VYIGGAKASKSLDAQDPAVALLKDPVKLADRIGPDAVRYFLLREVAFGQDGDMTWEKLVLRCNGDLGKNIGNLLNRVVSMTGRYLGGTFASKGAPLPQDATLRDRIGGLPARVAPLMERFEFHAALAEIFEAATAVNAYIEATAPWALSKQGRTEEVAGVLYRAADAVRVLAVLLSPFIPGMAARILEQLGIPDAPLRLETAQAAEYIKAGTRVEKGPVLFQTIDADQQP